MGPQLGSLLACPSQPAGEPRGRESGVTGAEPPRARADPDFEAQPGEAVDRGADRVGTEQLSGACGASLVGVERVCDALVAYCRLMGLYAAKRGCRPRNGVGV